MEDSGKKPKWKPVLWIGVTAIVMALLAALAVREIHGNLSVTLDKTEDELIELKKLLEAKKEENDKAAEKIVALKKSVESHRQEMGNAEEEIIDLKKALESRNEENEKLKGTISILEDQIQSAQPSERFISNFIKKRNPRVSSVVASEIAKNVLTFCKQNYVPPSLAVGVMEVESSYNPMAVSSKKAKGLMQVFDSAWKGKIDDESDLFEIDQNIRIGCEILNEFLQDKTIHQTLFAYLGEKNTDYVEKILSVAMSFEIELVRQEIQSEIKDTEGFEKEN